ncbi:MAG: RNA-guided endonuclease IscB, partial [Nitrospiraceae bacterium]|nr:RNA-guided endonuclease IscB [Nitrospiraceae bacterium]
EHRGQAIKNSLAARRAVRRGRRSRKTRYRAPRFNNRTRPSGWLPPSLQHRIETTLAWVERFRRLAPVVGIAQELVRFDMQKIANPEIAGVDYQQGTLAGYEVREYLLEKWGRACAYCGAGNVPLEIDHIHPRSKGGSDRVSNLTLACRACNQKKGNRPVKEFLAKKSDLLAKILSRAQSPLKDAAAVNTTRWALFGRLTHTGLPVETGSGGRTKFNRAGQEYPKAHWIDAACVGTSGEAVRLDPGTIPLRIRATGHGTRQVARTDTFGFPIRFCPKDKTHFGFRTGDLVRATVPSGKKAGIHVGRVAVRSSGSFNVRTGSGVVQGISHKHCRLLQRADGYGYSQIAKPKGMREQALSRPGMNAEVSRAIG